MQILLLKFLRPLVPYLTTAVLLLAVASYIVALKHHLQNANEKNVILMAQNAANVAAIQSYQAQTQKFNAALDTLDAQTLATSTATSQIAAKIKVAPAADDAPVAPVLSQGLDGLRALQGDAP